MYFLVIIQYAKNGTATQAVYQKPDYDSALVPFYTELAYRNENRLATVCLITDAMGMVVKRDVYNESAVDEMLNATAE